MISGVGCVSPEDMRSRPANLQLEVSPAYDPGVHPGSAMCFATSREMQDFDDAVSFRVIGIACIRA
jgi:hypothetical protein